jgi:hypothetical protein
MLPGRTDVPNATPCGKLTDSVRFQEVKDARRCLSWSAPAHPPQPQNALLQREVRKRAAGGTAGLPRTWPQLTVRGELGPARNRPTRYTGGRPDAEPQPNLCTLRSSPASIATVSRGADREVCSTAITSRLLRREQGCGR